MLFKCDFEYDIHPMCGLIQSDQDNFDWIIRYGSTGSAGTGPHGDHTSGDGTNAYIYNVEKKSIYKNVRLKHLPQRNVNTTSLCFKFVTYSERISTIAF